MFIDEQNKETKKLYAEAEWLYRHWKYEECLCNLFTIVNIERDIIEYCQNMCEMRLYVFHKLKLVSVMMQIQKLLPNTPCYDAISTLLFEAEMINYDEYIPIIKKLRSLIQK